MFRFEDGVWKVAIGQDDDRGHFAGTAQRSGRVAHERFNGQTVRCWLELYGSLGGLHVRALIGGELRPNGEKAVLEVAFGDDLSSGAQPNCPSALATPLVAGLPRDFAAAALLGLQSVPCDGFLAGWYVVDRGAYDEVGSGTLVFERAAGLWACCVIGLAREGAVDEDSLRRLIQQWN